MRQLDAMQPAGQAVFCRVDFNVPLESGEVANDSRIRRALPTVETLLGRGARLVLASHLGRPMGQITEGLRMAPVARHLSTLTDATVHHVPHVTGPEVAEAIAALPAGEALLLDNLRFDPGETAGDPTLADNLAAGIDLYVNEAFGCSHRAHASIVGLPERLPAYAGALLAAEIKALSTVRDAPASPFHVLLGGAKVADKLPLLEHLIERVDALIIGGGMAYTFLAAQGTAVGGSRVERDLFPTVLRYLEEAKARGVRVVLPIDHVVVPTGEIRGDAPASVATEIAPDQMGLDIGPATIKLVQDTLAEARTVFWNGPMGVFEHEAFRAGTLAVSQTLAASEAWCVVGGGDSVRAVEESGLADQIGHISTGGGAALEFLAGDELPGIAALERQTAASEHTAACNTAQ